MITRILISDCHEAITKKTFKIYLQCGSSSFSTKILLFAKDQRAVNDNTYVTRYAYRMIAFPILQSNDDFYS